MRDPTMTTGASDCRYQPDEVIGSGGTSLVYRASDPMLGRHVALKVERFGAHRERVCFRREREALAHQTNAFTVPLFDSGTDAQDRSWAVFPLYADGDLATHLRESGPLSAERAFRLGCDVAEALADLHRRGLVHRDVKPQNILLNGRSFVLADFGLAKPLADPTVRWAEEPGWIGTRPQESGTSGTPEYMSFNRLCGLRATAADDCHALCIVLSEALTGQHRYRSSAGTDFLLQLAERVRLERAVPSFPSGVPSALADVIERGVMAEDAFQNGGELLLALAGST